MRLSGVRCCYTWYRMKMRSMEKMDWKRRADELGAVSLKNVKSVGISLDPFYPGTANDSIRDVWYQLGTREKQLSNPYCKLSAKLTNDRKPPKLTINLENGKTLLISTEMLPSIELFKIINRYTMPPDQMPVQKENLSKKKYLETYIS